MRYRAVGGGMGVGYVACSSGDIFTSDCFYFSITSYPRQCEATTGGGGGSDGGGGGSDGHRHGGGVCDNSIQTLFIMAIMALTMTKENRFKNPKSLINCQYLSGHVHLSVRLIVSEAQ